VPCPNPASECPVGRAVRLVSFALRRAAALGIPFERLVVLTGWELGLVLEGSTARCPRPPIWTISTTGWSPAWRSWREGLRRQEP
jgi:hypothetical protein